MSFARLVAVLFALTPALASAQDGYTVEPLKAAPPAALNAAIKGELGDSGVKVLDSEGKPFAQIWLRKAIPASGKPAGPKGTIQYPILGEGEFLGVLQFDAEGHDYRDQSVPAGLYTLRYGLQPVNGDHLGVSPFRDYALLIPAAKDSSIAPLERKKLEGQSAEAAGSSHPTILMLLGVASGTKAPSVVRDEAKNTWGAVLGLPLSVAGDASPLVLPVQLVVSGSAM